MCTHRRNQKLSSLWLHILPCTQDRIQYWTPDLNIKETLTVLMLAKTNNEIFPLLWWLLQPTKVSYSPTPQRLDCRPSWADQKNILLNLNKHLTQYIYLENGYHIYFGIMIFIFNPPFKYPISQPGRKMNMGWPIDI